MPAERAIYLSAATGTWATVGLVILAFVIIVILLVVLRILRTLALQLDYLAYIKSVVQNIRKDIELLQKSGPGEEGKLEETALPPSDPRARRPSQ